MTKGEITTVQMDKSTRDRLKIYAVKRNLKMEDAIIDALGAADYLDALIEEGKIKKTEKKE